MNAGSIYGTSRGADINMDDLVAGSVTFQNSGTILSPETAVVIRAQQAGALVSFGPLENSGVIQGGVIALSIQTPHAFTFENSGSLLGDVLFNNSGDATLDNAEGLIVGDIIFGSGTDRYLGRDGEIMGRVTGGLGNDRLEMGQNADFANGGSDNDTVYGNSGDDTLLGDSGDDVLRGDAGHDSLDGGHDNDVLRGGAGDDTLLGDQGNDVLRGDAGMDSIDGGLDNDMLMGGHENDTLLGGAGNDTIHGNGGDDLLQGGGRADLLLGGKGDDTMSGGGSADTIVIRRVGNGDDEVTDFQNGADRVDISALGVQDFAELNTTFGALSQDTDGVVIDLAAAGGSGSIRLVGVTLADMDASDFIF